MTERKFEPAHLFTKYWRKSLADTALSKGRFAEQDLKKKDAISEQEWRKGQLGHDKEALIRGYFAGIPATDETVEVIVSPNTYKRISQHGHDYGLGILPQYLLPVSILLLMDRQGKFFPGISPIIARDLLAPLEEGFLTIGNLKEYDRYITQHPYQLKASEDSDGKDFPDPRQRTDEWCRLLEYADRLEATVCKIPLKDYLKQDVVYLEKGNNIAAWNVIALYDHLLETRECVPLFENLTYTGKVREKCHYSTVESFTKRTGHGTDGYGLASAQRDVLARLLDEQDGDILAVNGPPGTGKTTMLLSIIATQWVNSALKGGREAPITMAASANNQAVTNIIDAFGKVDVGTGPLAGRWLPNLPSYGIYLPAKAKECSAANRGYLTESLMNNQYEQREYIEKARIHYIQCAVTAFGNGLVSVSQGVSTIGQKMAALNDVLEQTYSLWKQTEKAKMRVLTQLGETPQNVLSETLKQKDMASTRYQTACLLDNRLRAFHQSEPLSEVVVASLLGWLRPVQERRLNRAISFITQNMPNDGVLDGVNKFTEIHKRISIYKQATSDQQDRTTLHHVELLNIWDDHQRLQQEWRTHLGQLDGLYLGWTAVDGIQSIEDQADKTIRFDLFRLATHYWEGVWLEETEKFLQELTEKGKTGVPVLTSGGAGGKGSSKSRKHIQKTWALRMMLTPCAVSTLYMLPKTMKAWSGRDTYLYNTIDLLIIDEAGQVTPDLAAASFALAKRALVIGDTQQIEPVWSLPESVDIGNLVACGLAEPCTERQDKEVLDLQGKTATVGSVMKMSQHSTLHHDNKALDRGMWLYEHRRCWDEIITYCSELCYKGTLQPKQGSAYASAKIAPLFPPMAYLHIDGKSQSQGGSRINRHEAKAIADWIAANREQIQQYYQGETISKVLGIVTPFGAQKTAIRSALEEELGSDNGITVGTVHALQGAERNLIIFSPVYSRHEAGGQFFFDAGSNMLNVAVSRAKHSFMVFGDMKIFDRKGNKPSSLLARHIFSSPKNEISTSIIPSPSQDWQ